MPHEPIQTPRVRFIPPALPRDASPELYRYADELHRHLRIAFEGLALEHAIMQFADELAHEDIDLTPELQEISNKESRSILLQHLILKWLKVIAFQLGEANGNQIVPEDLEEVADDEEVSDAVGTSGGT